MTRWVRPVPGPVVRPFLGPPGPYAAGHRGADLAAAPGTRVVAAGMGTVTFAGMVATSIHVVIRHPNGLRTGYSFLASVTVRAGQVVRAGDDLGTTGNPDPDSAHDGSALHLSLRRGDTYLDPMLLFAPVDLGAVVHLVPISA